MNNIKIFVVTHKKFDFSIPIGYIPIQVGSFKNEDLGYLKDNYGKNISSKNPNYCELTALYNIWKNDKKTNIVGFCHYRRYFFHHLLPIKKSRILSINKIKKVLEKYDIILPRRHYLGMSVQTNYAKDHHLKDLLECKKIIIELYPEYSHSFDVILKRNWLYCFNMFILDRKNYHDYCNWLFSILFELEKRIDITSYNDYNKRVYGFLAERLLNVWIEKNKLKIKHFPVYNIEKKIPIQLMGQIKRRFLNIFLHNS